MTGLEKASFGIGCFWSEGVFGKLEGVKKTRVGYAGGEKENPSYENMGDHTETVQVEYETRLISYDELLDYFWSSHDPTRKKKRQYRSVIFYHTEEQRKKAESYIKEKKQQLEGIKTDIEPLENFYLAEDHHQKYRLRHSRRFEDFEHLSNEELRESEEATKANAEF